MGSIPEDRNDRTATLCAALGYAARGWPVLPLHHLDTRGICSCGDPNCEKPGKHPRWERGTLEHGCLDATTDRATITAWFNRWPHANIGIATGPESDIFALDAEHPAALDALEAEHGTLPATRTHASGNGGLHVLFRYPSEAGASVRNSVKKLGDALDVRGAGGYIVAPPSITTRPYEVLDDCELAEPPAWLLERLREPERKASGRGTSPTGPVSIDVAGPPILDGTRDDTLASIAGRLHDGTRDLDQLTRDLDAIDQARCKPPKGPAAVARIARSIHWRAPCRPRPEVTPRVLAMVDHLEALASERKIVGMAGATGWALYYAGLEAARRFGREHPEGFTVSVDSRTWAQMAGTEASTVSRWLRRTPAKLVEVLERGSGRRSSTVLFRCPEIGGYLQQSSTLGGRNTNEGRSVATDPLLRTLYRSRWPGRTAKARKRGVARGARKVRQAPQPAPPDVTPLLGKSRAALLYKIREHPGASRAELAQRIGVKPDSLKKPLKWLVDADLVVRTERGHYAAASELARRVEDVRDLGGEPQADRLQIARHERERDAYRDRHRVSADPAPSDSDLREQRESYPARRRAHIEAAIAALFAERPEYRGRRVGQIVCKLPDYLGESFPRGELGLPKDAEVAALLDGVAA